jgi:hypothetical protein
VALGIVENRPRASPITTTLNDAVRANSFEGLRQVGDLEEDDGLVRRGIILCSTTLKTDEASGSSELGVVACLRIGQLEPKDFPVKLLSSLQVGEVELNASKAEGWRSHSIHWWFAI